MKLLWLKEIIGDAYTEDMDAAACQAIGKDFVARADFNAKNTRVKELEAQVGQLEEAAKGHAKQLDELKKSAGDNEELKKQIETLQQENANQKKAHEAEMTQLRLDNAIDAALTAAGAKNIKAVRALLDTSKVKVGEDGKLTGFDDLLSAVQKSDSYLFAEKQQKQNFKGFQPGASGNVKPGTKVDMSKMTYEELANYIDQNPDAE